MPKRMESRAHERASSAPLSALEPIGQGLLDQAGLGVVLRHQLRLRLDGLGEAVRRAEVTSKGVCATRGRTNRVMRKIGRIQACVPSLFPGSPGAGSNDGS